MTDPNTPTPRTDAERVPVCGSRGALTVSRAIWDEAWIAYAKQYGHTASQHARLLREGFYAEELDDLRPGWRPVDQRIVELERTLAAQRTALPALFDEAERTGSQWIAVREWRY